MKYCRTKLAEPTRGRNTYHRETNITDDVESSHYQGYICVRETRIPRVLCLGEHGYWETHITVTTEVFMVSVLMIFVL